jgi:plasmid stabilization system protein ParE
MYPIYFHPDTKLEIKESFDWYQLQSKGLGHDFIQELEEAFSSIQSLAFTWPKLGQTHRRFILGRFPFSVIYKIRENKQIFIVAIMHNHRKPNYWEERK